MPWSSGLIHPLPMPRPAGGRDKRLSLFVCYLDLMVYLFVCIGVFVCLFVYIFHLFGNYLVGGLAVFFLKFFLFRIYNTCYLGLFVSSFAAGLVFHFPCESYGPDWGRI